MTKRKIHVMNIFVSFMNIYDHSQREAQNHLWTFMASLMIIYDQKKREAQKTEDHLWSFLTKKPRSAKPKNIYAS